jgi:AraC-like DNA-binding protein
MVSEEVLQNAIKFAREWDEFPVRAHVYRSDETFNFEKHNHPALEFHLIRHGMSKYSIRDVDYPCEKNSVVVIHEDEPHIYIPSQDCLDKNMSLMFEREIMSDRMIARTALQRIRSLHHLILSERQASIVEFLITEIGVEQKRRSVHWQNVIIDHIETFMAILHRVAEQTVLIPEINDPLVQEVLKYLEGRLTAKSPLIEVAHRFGVCEFTLSKRFNQTMGFGFREYLLQRRILAAQTLLEQTDMKIASVAGKVGFDTLTAFNRYFRKVTGMTPIVYRKLATMEQLDIA